MQKKKRDEHIPVGSGVDEALLLLGLGFKKVGFPGITPFSIAKIILINPEIPAAGSECPILLLI